MTYSIENIAAPKETKRAGSPSIRLALESVLVDQSFFVPATDFKTKGYFHSRAHGIAKEIGIKISTRIEVKDGVGGYRVFRVE